jgi:hypothetical protein
MGQKVKHSRSEQCPGGREIEAVLGHQEQSCEGR